MEKNIKQFLTPKQKSFCDEYLKDRNATRAALEAGYSRDTAKNGYLMTLPKVQMYLEQQMEHITNEAGVTQAMVLRELCKIAFGNMGNYFLPDGSMKPMDELNDDEKAALWSVSIGDNCNKSDSTAGGRVKMYNKMVALDRIAKHIGFYKPQSTEPKVVFKYITTDMMTEDDTFDDPILQQEIEKWDERGAEEEAMEEWRETLAQIEEDDDHQKDDNEFEGLDDDMDDEDMDEVDEEDIALTDIAETSMGSMPTPAPYVMRGVAIGYNNSENTQEYPRVPRY